MPFDPVKSLPMFFLQNVVFIVALLFIAYALHLPLWFPVAVCYAVSIVGSIVFLCIQCMRGKFHEEES